MMYVEPVPTTASPAGAHLSCPAGSYHVWIPYGCRYLS